MDDLVGAVRFVPGLKISISGNIGKKKKKSQDVTTCTCNEILVCCRPSRELVSSSCQFFFNEHLLFYQVKNEPYRQTKFWQT